MSGYGTLDLKPELGPEVRPKECEPPDKLKPLPAVNIELDSSGEANKDLLAQLIVNARNASDETKQGWTAADLNNLACAHYWFNRARGKAISYFEEASKKPNLADGDKQIITCNLNLLKSLSNRD